MVEGFDDSRNAPVWPIMSSEWHEVDRSGLPTGGLVPTRYGHLFLDELDRLVDRLDGAHRSGCDPTRPNGGADVLNPRKRW